MTAIRIFQCMPLTVAFAGWKYATSIELLICVHNCTVYVANIRLMHVLRLDAIIYLKKKRVCYFHILSSFVFR